MDYDNSKVYCGNRKCKNTMCLRNYVNTPFNVVIKRDTYEPNMNGKCKYELRGD